MPQIQKIRKIASNIWILRSWFFDDFWALKKNMIFGHFRVPWQKVFSHFCAYFLIFFVFFLAVGHSLRFCWFFLPKATKNVEKTMKKQALPPTSSPVPTISLPMTSSSFSQWMVSSRDLSQWMGGRCFRLCRLNYFVYLVLQWCGKCIWFGIVLRL